jgi:histidine ammonia-lyase/tyrosine ammonia-lyase
MQTTTLLENCEHKPMSDVACVGVTLGPDRTLTCEDVEHLTRHERISVAFSPASVSAMKLSRTVLQEALQRGEAIYGLTTGFGPHVAFGAAQGCDHGSGLIAHLGAGIAPYAAAPIVRASMLIRCQAIAQGMSGIDLEAAHAFTRLLAHNVIPAVPEIGSVGASGDLIPLAHVARVLTGEGTVLSAGGPRPAREALALAGLAPVALTGRDALALVNGTAFMTAYASLAVARAERLLCRAEEITGWLYALLGSRLPALDERLHLARGHMGQVRSARMIRESAMSLGAAEDLSRPLQEVYSLRCAPQILGACRENLDFARGLIEREMNGVNDNPVIWTRSDELAVLHGGNFQGQQIAFASDALNAALVQAAVLAERQLDVLMNPELTGGAPLLLAWQPGETSGMAGAQITATAIVAEMRHHGGPVATSSIPTNGRNQDVVSMGTLAARAAFGQTDRLAAVLAILTLGARQLDGLRRSGRAPGQPTRSPTWAEDITPFTRDVALHDAIMELTREALAAPHLGASGKVESELAA